MFGMPGITLMTSMMLLTRSTSRFTPPLKPSTIQPMIVLPTFLKPSASVVMKSTMRFLIQFADGAERLRDRLEPVDDTVDDPRADVRKPVDLQLDEVDDPVLDPAADGREELVTTLKPSTIRFSTHEPIALRPPISSLMKSTMRFTIQPPTVFSRSVTILNPSMMRPRGSSRRRLVDAPDVHPGTDSLDGAPQASASSHFAASSSSPGSALIPLITPSVIALPASQSLPGRSEAGQEVPHRARDGLDDAEQRVDDVAERLRLLVGDRTARRRARRSRR
jgi:hypothetical protein